MRRMTYQEKEEELHFLSKIKDLDFVQKQNTNRESKKLQAIIMADAIISVVVQRVTAIIEDQIRYEINLVRGVEKEVLDLADKLKTMRNVLDDAEKRGVREESVKGWLKELEDTAYELDDILDEWNYTLLKHKFEDEQPEQKVCCSFIPSSCSCFKKLALRRGTAKKIQNVKVKLDQILKEKDDFNFVMSLPPTHDSVPKSWRVQSTSSIELEKVHGKDVDRNKNEIVSKLMMLNVEPLVLSIVGMGGIGKTTLAQLVYNDSRVDECFDVRIWICVSDPFDVAGVARGIVESVTKETISPNTTQLEVVIQTLRDCISGKKFLLVLDDVWTEEYNNWEPLKINLKYGAPSSKILVTTRNERVARMMGTFDNEIYRPQQLTDEECWLVMRCISLFGRSEEECAKFEGVGMKIASKCKGLPLAANVLGSLLQFKNSLEEWEEVLESEIWQLEKVELDLFPHLVLSYNELSPTLKRCFSYCAIFPKDHEIGVGDLIQNWMALGYLGSDLGNDGVELKGRGYFNNLAMRSLFQNFEKFEYEGQIKRCKMHDIIHDFAQFLRKIKDKRAEASVLKKRSCQVCNPFLVSQAHEYRSLFLGEESFTYLCDCFTCLRVLKLRRKLNGSPLGIEKFIHLRWLDMSSVKLSKEDLESICKLYLLQTLLLMNCYIEEIPKEIENLVELRHFDLSGNYMLKELPESMCSLHRLQTLDLLLCHNLRLLPEGLGELSGLRALTELRGGRGWNKLGVLKKLTRLTGSLRFVIEDISSTSDLEELVKDAREAELRNKEHIQILLIRFDCCESDGRKLSSPLWVDLLEALEPNHNLKHLRIRLYMGHELPRWISSPISLLKKIVLCEFSRLSSLPAMGKLPFLEDLKIMRINEMKVVGVELLGIKSSSSSSSSATSVAVAFPKLKKLSFKECYKWEEWEDITAEEEESTAIELMPSLSILKITICICLKKLPHRLLRKAKNLRVLDVRNSIELKRCYGDKNGDPWRSISQSHPQLQLVTQRQCKCICFLLDWIQL